MTPARDLDPRLEAAIWSVLHHHRRSSPSVVHALTGRVFIPPPPKPTSEQRAMASEIVEVMLELHWGTLRDAIREVLGEEAPDDPR